jgi:hypothetical protein
MWQVCLVEDKNSIKRTDGVCYHTTIEFTHLANSTIVRWHTYVRNTVAFECFNLADTVEHEHCLFIVLRNVKGALRCVELESGRR